MHKINRLLALAALIVAAWTLPSLADNWVAVKLRGGVMQLVDNQWVPLRRGDVVSDTRVVRTSMSGRVQFMRDRETVDLEPNTQIQIFDRTGQRFTTVKQYFGTVTVEANVENVKHFEVQTPYLAAVVKGTIFVVKSDKRASSVVVKRGHVAVEDRSSHRHVLLSVGQSAATGAGEELTVGGKVSAESAKAEKEAEKAAEKAEKAAEKAAKAAEKGDKGKGNSGHGSGDVASVEITKQGATVSVGQVVSVNVGGNHGHGHLVNVQVLGLKLKL